jgi:SNF2 family DNA or RNA helicase
MLQREMDSDVKGGILADDMGLGKTIQAIGLICANKFKPTLIVTTVGTVGQWRDTLINFGNIRPIVVNSSYKGMLPEECEVVVTAYSSFQRVNGQVQCFGKVNWGRIILDEGHTIRNHKTKVFIELSKLTSTCKWILSGTPIQNSIKDIKNLCQWIGIDINQSIETLYAKYVLRRTQENEGRVNPRLALPPLETKVVTLPFKYQEEQALYSEVEDMVTQTIHHTTQKTQTSKYTTVVEGITRCRQVCTHIQIYYDGLNKKASKKDNEGTPILKKRRFDTETATLQNVKSSKMEFIRNDVANYITKTKSKCLIFCTWTTEMNIIQKELHKMGIISLIYDGSLSRDDKENVLYNFKNSNIPVLILQIVCGSTGLDLYCATRVYITSPNWNPCIELQAIGRAYRKGQVSKVTCVRIVMEGTIEEKCFEIQKRKMKLISESQNDSLIHRLGATLDDQEMLECFS